MIPPHPNEMIPPHPDEMIPPNRVEKLRFTNVKVHIIMVMRMKRLLTMLLLVLAGFGFAQTLSDGTELLMTDLDSQKIVGHGKVFNGQIYLNLSETAEGFFLYVVTPNGDVATHHGEVKANGLVAVFADNGDLLNFADVLRDRGVKLVVQRVPELTETATDDDQLEPATP
jgi:hypothetical protein